MQKNTTIVGAGLVGSLLSIYLAKRNHKVKIYERRADMRKLKMSAGKSINLALSDRGLLALEKIGLAEEIKKIAIPMHCRFIHNIDGTTVTQPYGKQGQYINSVSRATLNMKLMDLAEANGVEISFDNGCHKIDWKKNEITFQMMNDELRIKNENSDNHSSFITHNFELLFGSDGAFSAARLQHQLHHDKFNYQQYYIDCGYKELTIPPTANGDFAMEPNALHIWPRKDYMLIALPNIDKTFTCTLFFPFEGELSFSKIDTQEKIVDFLVKILPMLCH